MAKGDKQWKATDTVPGMTYTFGEMWKIEAEWKDRKIPCTFVLPDGSRDERVISYAEARDMMQPGTLVPEIPMKVYVTPPRSGFKSVPASDEDTNADSSRTRKKGAS